MMFCTTFLSAPSEELYSEGGIVGGAAPVAPGCLSSFHCLVLPQDELYPTLSDRPVGTEGRAQSLAGKMLVDVGEWGRVGGQCARAASPSPKCFHNHNSDALCPSKQSGTKQRQNMSLNLYPNQSFGNWYQSPIRKLNICPL